MRIVLRIITWPIILVLSVFIAFCTFVLSCSAGILSIISVLLGFMAIMILCFSSFTAGISGLVVAFLISPFGLPMVAAWLIAKIADFKCFIQDAVEGI